MKIYVLGNSGMLGRYVFKYLQKAHEVIPVSRDTVDAANVREDSLTNTLRKIGVQEGDVLINCVGTIKPRVDELGDLNAVLVNSVFPRVLAASAEDLGAHVIHPTTDCVYSGLRGKYTETDKYDVSDIYGMSKALGETPSCTMIRTSIIGEEVSNKRSLVEWVKSNKDQAVPGFTNHIWNGITCLQFAKVCESIIVKNLFWKGVRHVHSDTVTKKELVELISDIYDLNVTVHPKETPLQCDRSMITNYPEVLEQLSIPPLKQQVEEMKDFHEALIQG